MSRITLNPEALTVESFEPAPGDANAPFTMTNEFACQEWSNFPAQYTCWYDRSCARGFCDS